MLMKLVKLNLVIDHHVADLLYVEVRFYIKLGLFSFNKWEQKVEDFKTIIHKIRVLKPAKQLLVRQMFGVDSGIENYNSVTNITRVLFNHVLNQLVVPDSAVPDHPVRKRPVEHVLCNNPVNLVIDDLVHQNYGQKPGQYRIQNMGLWKAP